MKKPYITSEVLTQLTSATPARVHKRLDKNPGVANDWIWSGIDTAIRIETGTQVVELKPVGGIVHSVDQITCDCLLAPKCLHILASVALLEIKNVDESIAELDPSRNDETAEEPATQSFQSSDEQLLAEDDPSFEETANTAGELFDAASQIVVTGYDRASTVMIAKLMQAAHHARATGLHWPAAAAIRVVEGIRKLRHQVRGADAATLRRDVFELLSTTRMIQQQTAGWRSLPGTARRKYHPRDKALNLQGIFVEPILTESGYAGMVVYLKDESHQWYTVSDVRLGDSERLSSVWNGGIPIGNKTVSAKELVNSRVLIRGGGVSDDGRLGLGQKSEFAWKPGDVWFSESLCQWTSTDLATQMRRVWNHRYSPELARPAGWDLVGLSVEVLGASGQFLVVRTVEDQLQIPFGIHSEHNQLEYRRNLQRLAASPGMLLNVIARFDLTRPAALMPLAIAPCEEAEISGTDERQKDQTPRPKLMLPDSAAGCWQLGWQRLQPEHFSRTTEPIALDKVTWTNDASPLLDPMQRRVQSMLQGGHQAIPDLASDALQLDAARFLESWFETAAALLLELSTASATLRASDTHRETRQAITRLSELWIASQSWCETIQLINASRTWIPTGVIE